MENKEFDEFYEKLQKQYQGISVLQPKDAINCIFLNGRMMQQNDIVNALENLTFDVGAKSPPSLSILEGYTDYVFCAYLGFVYAIPYKAFLTQKKQTEVSVYPTIVQKLAALAVADKMECLYVDFYVDENGIRVVTNNSKVTELSGRRLKVDDIHKKCHLHGNIAFSNPRVGVIEVDNGKQRYEIRGYKNIVQLD